MTAAPIMDPEHAKRRVRRAKRRGIKPNQEDLTFLASLTANPSPNAAPGQSTIPPELNQPFQRDPPINQIPYGERDPDVSRVLAGDSKPSGARGRDWQDFTTKRLGPILIVILYFALGDMDKAEFYAPTPQECRGLAPHLARLLPKIEQWLNAPEWVHQALITSDNSIGLIALVVGYLDRTGIADHLTPKIIHTFSAKRNRGNGKTSPIDQALRERAAGNNGYPDPASRIELAELNLAGIGLQYQ